MPLFLRFIRGPLLRFKCLLSIVHLLGVVKYINVVEQDVKELLKKLALLFFWNVWHKQKIRN